MKKLNRPAKQVHAALLDALERLRQAEECAVFEFAEILRRRLYRPLGYASIMVYGIQALGFSENKTRQFIRVAQAMDELPALKQALDAKHLTWTKARTIARVATKRSEKQWLDLAANSNNRQLEAKVKQAREQQKSRASLGEVPRLFDSIETEALPTPKAQVTYSLSPELKARLGACIEALRKQGDRRNREELLVAAFAALLSQGAGLKSVSRDICTVPYQIVIYKCEDCGGAHLPTGERLAPVVVKAAGCDCRTQRDDKPNRASVPPAMRRKVLARDRYCCTSPGCGATSFLEVHHRRPRSAGGGNAIENLVTLCSACHRFTHERKPLDPPLMSRAT